MTTHADDSDSTDSITTTFEIGDHTAVYRADADDLNEDAVRFGHTLMFVCEALGLAQDADPDPAEDDVEGPQGLVGAGLGSLEQRGPHRQGDAVFARSLVILVGRAGTVGRQATDDVDRVPVLVAVVAVAVVFDDDVTPALRVEGKRLVDGPLARRLGELQGVDRVDRGRHQAPPSRPSASISTRLSP
jgi:hypothetical protein